MVEGKLPWAGWKVPWKTPYEKSEVAMIGLRSKNCDVFCNVGDRDLDAQEGRDGESRPVLVFPRKWDRCALYDLYPTFKQ